MRLNESRHIEHVLFHMPPATPVAHALMRAASRFSATLV
jgi:hypothetical protein